MPIAVIVFDLYTWPMVPSSMPMPNAMMNGVGDVWKSPVWGGSAAMSIPESILQG